MTETPVKPDETQAETAQTPSVEALPPLAQALLSASQSTHSAIEKLVADLSKGDNVGQLMTEAIAESTDAEVKTLRDKIEKAHASINSWTKAAEDKVRPTLEIPSEEKIKELDGQYKAKIAEYNGYDLVFKSEVAKDDDLDSGSLSLSTYLGDLPKRKGKSTPAGTSGISRPRVSKVEYGKGLDRDKITFKMVGDNDSSTFSHLAVELKKNVSGYSVAASDFVESWLTQNGQPANGDWRDLPEVTTFSWSATDDKGETQNFWVRVTR